MRDRAGSSRSSMGRRPRSQVARGLDGRTSCSEHLRIARALASRLDGV